MSDDGRKTLYTPQERRQRNLVRVKTKREKALVVALRAIATGVFPNIDHAKGYASAVLTEFNLLGQ